MDWPLRAKMAALLVVTSLVPLGVVALVNIREARQRLLATTAGLLAARGDQLLDHLDTFHRGYQTSISGLAHLPDLMEFCRAVPHGAPRRKVAVRAILDVYPATDANVRGVAVLDLTGMVMLATEDPLVGMDLSHREYVREALAGAAVISDIHMSEPQVGSVPTIAYLAPVHGSDGKLLGSVALWVHAASFWDIAKASKGLAGPGSAAVLSDAQGIRIAHTHSDDMVFHPSGALDSTAVSALVAERRFGERTRTLLEDVRAFPKLFESARSRSPDKAMFRAFAPVNQLWHYGIARRLTTVPWTIFYMVPEKFLDAQIATMTRRNLVFAVTIILIALFAGTLFAAAILRPIRSLSKATASLATGDLAARVPRGHADELGRLGTSFNAMAERIQTQSTALQRAQEDLELRVEARTVELAQATTHLEIEVAQRTRVEERYRRFFDEDLAGAFITTVDGQILDCNPAFARILGFASPDEARGSSVLSVFPDPEVGRSMVERLRVDRRILNEELELRRRDGAPVHVIENIVGSFEATGELAELTGYIVDVTDRKRAEDQLRQAQKMEAIGQLAGGVAHDFNNLLGVIIGYAEMVAKHLPSGNPAGRYVTAIRQAADRAAALTRQLLAFSRKQILQPRVVDLNEITADMEKLIARLIGEDIDLVKVRHPGSAFVLADPSQLEQIVLNLAVNARDAMPQGGSLTVEIAVVDLDDAYVVSHQGTRPGRYVMLAVSDTGVGMNTGTQARIFEPFFTTKELGKGTGLGLSTVYGIVKQSGGCIWVYSEPGRGATFKVYLPRVEEGAEPATPLVAQASPPRGSETILLVEDEEMLRELIEESLATSGYNVLVAKHGAEALGIAGRREGTIHLLLTDTVMPGMGGRELAKHLVEARQGLKVLYMSGYTDDAVVRHGVLAAEVAFLQKPFTPDALARKVRDVLDA
jgi:two-component system, cell cycle sensor histidine kinase and response regulator CckA